MVRTSPCIAWSLGVASLLSLAAGCQSAAKAPAAAAGVKSQTPAATASTATPGTAEFSTSNKLQNPVKVHLAYALWHEQEGNLVEARGSYDKVLEESPKNVDAMLGLARLDIAIGRMDDAEKRLSRAQKIAPKNPQVAIALGQYYTARSDWPRALEQMTLARELAPYDPVSAYHLGYVQARSGDLAAAQASFTEAVGAAEAQYNLAHILHEQGNLAGAEEHLQRAISLKPDLAQAQSLLLTVRNQRQSSKMQSAQASGFPRTPPVSTPSSGSVQPASYTEPASTSSFDPAPVR